MYDGHIADTWTDTQIGLKLLQEIFNTAENAIICEKNMRYAYFAKIWGKCGKVPNT